MKISILSLLLAASLLAFVACGDDDDDAGTDTPTATPTETSDQTAEPTATPVPTPTPTRAPEPFTGSQFPSEREDPDVPPVAILSGLLTEPHEIFDRITFEFRDNMPGYRIEYVDPPVLADGSGEQIEIEGEAFLQVRFSAAQAHNEAGNPTIPETEIIPEDLESVGEIELTGDFEGNVTLVLGLPEQLDFRVIDVDFPNQVRLDIAHP